MICPFCQINKTRNKILKEGKNTIVIFSNPRLMRGHLLVIPKRHVKKLSELSQEEQKELFDTAIEFQEKILQKLASGCDIRQHYRPFIKQNNLKINHLHIHLQPRELNDELYQKSQKYHRDIFKSLENQEVKEITQLFFK